MTYPAQAPMPATVRNGMGVTSLVLGIVGVALAWIPFVGFLGFILGVLAIIFGGLAVYRAHTGKANNKVMSYFGLGLGILAFVLSTAVWASTANELNKTMNEPVAGSSGASGGVFEPAPAPAPKPGEIPGDGVFMVGEDIEPGTYRTSTPGCYYERRSEVSSTFSSIIDNGYSDGPSIVTIEPSDVVFKTMGCGTWVKS